MLNCVFSHLTWVSATEKENANIERINISSNPPLPFTPPTPTHRTTQYLKQTPPDPVPSPPTMDSVPSHDAPCRRHRGPRDQSRDRSQQPPYYPPHQEAATRDVDRGRRLPTAPKHFLRRHLRTQPRRRFWQQAINSSRRMKR